MKFPLQQDNFYFLWEPSWNNGPFLDAVFHGSIRGPSFELADKVGSYTDSTVPVTSTAQMLPISVPMSALNPCFSRRHDLTNAILYEGVPCWYSLRRVILTSIPVNVKFVKQRGVCIWNTFPILNVTLIKHIIILLRLYWKRYDYDNRKLRLLIIDKIKIFLIYNK